MRRTLAIASLLIAAGCGPKSGSKTPKDNYDADARSGPDSKRSSAQQLPVNKPHTDEVSYQNQDKTDCRQHLFDEGSRHHILIVSYISEYIEITI